MPPFFDCEISVWAGILLELAKEQFCYPATQQHFNKLEQRSQRSGMSRGQAFEDFRHCGADASRSETLFEKVAGEATIAEPRKAAIIKVPQWLARLEPSLLASEGDVEAPAEGEPASVESRRDEPSKSEQELF